MIKQARTVVIWNPSAGSADGAAAVREQLRSMTNVEIRLPQDRDESIEATIRAVEGGAELIVAAGGDGTVSSVIDGLMRSASRPILGILPLGTGNDLARSLALPREPRDALEVLSTANVSTIDSVHVTSSKTERWFGNMLTGGNTGRYMQHMTDDVKRLWGPMCYLRGIVDVIRDLKVYTIHITCDDNRPERFEALNVFVANGRYSGGGLEVSPEARLNDGLLDIVIVRDGDPGDIAGLSTQYVVANYLQHKLIAFRQGQRITIDSQPRMPLTADGDAIGQTPLLLTVQPQCLQVLVPEAALSVKPVVGLG